MDRDGLRHGASPWRRRACCGSRRATGGRGQARTAGGQRRAKARAAVRQGKPLESEPWTWLRGETNPQGRWRRKPSRACETPRAERTWAWDARGTWTPPVDVAKREGTPRKVLGAGRRRAGAVRETLERRRSAREDEPACASERGTAAPGRPRRRVGNDDARAGSGNPIVPIPGRTQHSEARPVLRRGGAVGGDAGGAARRGLNPSQGERWRQAAHLGRRMPFSARERPLLRVRVG